MFDSDGVIVDSLEYFIGDFTAACHENGFTALADARDVLALFDNNVYAAMQERGIDTGTIDKILKAYAEKAAEHINKLKIFTGMDEVLLKIAQDNLVYIITSNVSAITTEILKKNGITCFAGVIGADIEKSKIKKIQRLIRQYPDEPAYYVGDTVGDMHEGREAGARTIGAAWGWHGAAKLKASGPDFLVNAPGELVELLR